MQISTAATTEAPNGRQWAREVVNEFLQQKRVEIERFCNSSLPFEDVESVAGGGTECFNDIVGHWHRQVWGNGGDQSVSGGRRRSTDADEGRLITSPFDSLSARDKK